MQSSTLRTMNRSLTMWGWFELAILRRMRRSFVIFMKICLWWKDWLSFIIATVTPSFLNFNSIKSCKWTVTLSDVLRRRVRIILIKWDANLVGLGFKKNTSFPSETLVFFQKVVQYSQYLKGEYLHYHVLGLNDSSTEDDMKKHIVNWLFELTLIKQPPTSFCCDAHNKRG